MLWWSIRSMVLGSNLRVWTLFWIFSRIWNAANNRSHTPGAICLVSRFEDRLPYLAFAAMKLQYRTVRESRTMSACAKWACKPDLKSDANQEKGCYCDWMAAPEYLDSLNCNLSYIFKAITPKQSHKTLPKSNLSAKLVTKVLRVQNCPYCFAFSQSFLTIRSSRRQQSSLSENSLLEDDNGQNVAYNDSCSQYE